MSVNITVHAKGQPTPSSVTANCNLFSSLDSVRQSDNQRRRKERLEQVRQQSKELAAKVRKNFQAAKTKQLAYIQKVKQDELNNWKRKHIAKLQADYQNCLEDVGEAHKAAEAAEQCEIWFQERKAAQQAAALMRGKQAESKLAGEIQERENKKPKKKKEYKPSKSVGVQVSGIEKEKKEETDGLADESISSANTLSAFEQFKKAGKSKSLPGAESHSRHLSPDFISSDDELLASALDRSILDSPRKPVRKLVEQPKALPTVGTRSAAPIPPSKTKSSLLVSPSKQSSATTASTKVQYYDYNTKYRKEYDQPDSIVHRNDKSAGEPNAMQEANRLERLQNEMLNARRQPAIADRSKLALEKLQTRKDYENLKAELDKLVKAESQVKGLDLTKKPLLTEAQHRKQNETRQKRMNEAVEDLTKRRVLITCPRVRDPPRHVPQPSQPSQINVAAGRTDAVTLPGDDSLIRATNSSDSCSSILLGNDPCLVRANISVPAEKEPDKVAQLKELLEKINEQKKLLTEELRKEEEIDRVLKVPEKSLKSTKSQTDNGILNLQKRQKQLDEQQQELKRKEKEIRELEKQLKEKLNRLERDKLKPTLPVQVETHGVAKGDVQTVPDLSSSDSNGSFQSGSEIPVKIVITLNDKMQKKVKKTPKKVVSEVRKRKKAKDAANPPLEAPECQPKVPTEAKVSRPSPKKVIPPSKALPEPDQSPISSTTSTVYRQPPAKIENRMSQLLKQIDQKQTTADKIPIPKPPSAKVIPKHQLRKETTPALVPPGRQNLDPVLMQYIVRLLGMSRQSIDQLGVSSSTTISTPHDSVVNVSENQSSAEDDVLKDQSRLDKLRKFINENYNFLNEIDETLKEQELNGTLDENISRVGDIWMRTLSRKENEIRQKKISQTKTSDSVRQPAVQQSPPVKESSLKSILKSPKRTPDAKVAKIITPQGHVEIINLSDREEQEVLEKYAQLTENCSKRISELSDMIQKVREEKKKLIENSLSSSEQQESTKYMDIPQPLMGASIQRDNNLVPPKTPLETSPQSTRDDPVSEEINAIFIASRQIGLSKDSGIAMSRPVTSSDFRDSPDARPQNAVVQQLEPAKDFGVQDTATTAPVSFEPVLKDIPKVTPRIIESKNGGGTQQVVQVHAAKDPAPSKRTKPPVAITRYSPQLDEAATAHELSTILEVETPMASRANISIPPSDKLDPADRLLVEARDKLLEHARALGYEGFPNYDEYVHQKKLEGAQFDPEKTNFSRVNELLEMTDKSEQLRYQKYLDPAPEINVTEETLKGDTSVNKQSEQASNSSSSASLPDVIAELKLRNIIDKSFNNSLDDSNRSTPDSGSIEIFQPVPVVEKSPTKRKHYRKPDDTGESTVQKTDSLERDLNQLGLRWASSMLKKNQEVLQQDHSSSSSLSLVEDIRRGSERKQTSSIREQRDSQPISGKPLNLKEFIARELMIRTHSDLNSLSDSSSPCSLLLKSLLDISHINTSTPELLTQTTTDKNVQRTSTPVASKSSSSSSRLAERTREPSLSAAVGLFSGESRISSVHMSSSSGGELTVSNAKLNLDRLEKGEKKTQPS
ncbi:titin isoform X2 [Malaya genurostris]|uniref:titin isoform X2 n=1 Tax=Malaya genurostris TaxID=325434 RepID=UPI0026F3EA54|nr:titin isoform X2 [Malaya genurostris]